MPYSIQVHQNHPEASLEAGAFDVLSGCDRLFEADHWLWNSEKRPKIGVSVCEGQISSVNGDKYVNITDFFPLGT